MKQGMTLTELAQEVERQHETKKDYVADSRLVRLGLKQREPVVALGGVGEFALSTNGHNQLAGKLGIPKLYYERMLKDAPELLVANANGWLEREQEKRMFRTLDGRVRAVLSDRYRPLDNFDLADAVLPLLREYNVQVESCQITETRMYIKGLCPWLDRELEVPEGLKMGVGHTFFLRKVYGAITISNSEVGAGMVSINPGIFERQCTNLATFRDEGFGRMHVGKKATGEGEDVFRYLSDETRRVEDAAVWMKVRDIVKATMDGKVMDSIVRKMTEARGDLISGNPEKVVEVFAKKTGLNETEKGGLLRHLVGSGEMTRYGLQWAVTRMSQEVESYDRASELERLGGQVIELPRHDWQQIAQAA